MIYDIYLKYISKDDIHVYSVDEVFIDVTTYLKYYQMSAHDIAMMIIKDVLKETGITATAGIGPNLYLCKVAMDIVAKHVDADEDGVRIAELDEMSYREILWNHVPLTDFWRIGPGITKRLRRLGIYTQGDIARQSILDEGLLYKEFGINAELLIDHAWGYESASIEDIKSYEPIANSVSVGQVLARPYEYDEARTVCKEMIDNLCIELVSKGVVAGNLHLGIGYDSSNDLKSYLGVIETDGYGRSVPKASGGTVNIPYPTSSYRVILNAFMKAFDEKVVPGLTIRRIHVSAGKLADKNHKELALPKRAKGVLKISKEEEKELVKDENLAQAIIDIKNKYGKNAALKGTNFEKGATGIERNKQVGGHNG